MTKAYFRPIVQTDAHRTAQALRLAGGWCWFDRVERLSRDAGSEILPLQDLPDDVLQDLTAPRPPMAGLDFSRPRLMGIVNVTPDSFSDGGRFLAPDAAAAHAEGMAQSGADILDVGGESTRPGAETVPHDEEIRRVVPVIQAIKASVDTPVSVDTRKTQVADAALTAGADLLNDVSAFSHDPSMVQLVSESGAPVCLMHAQGTPDIMQNAPTYANVLLDIYDFLEEKRDMAEAAGIPRSRIMLDPGIGFGKTLAHNLALLRRISLFHGLGCAVLLGVSRKRFIGTLGNAPQADQRAAGSIALGLGAVMQGVQVLRVHDIEDTRQALNLAMAVTDNK